MHARNILLGFALTIIGTLFVPAFGRIGAFMIVAGVIWSWWHVAQVMMEKPWSPLKLKAMQALAGFGAMAVVLTPLRIQPRGIMLLALLGAAAGWFAPMLLNRKNKK
jgi:hypothetical protein